MIIGNKNMLAARKQVKELQEEKVQIKKSEAAL